MLSRIQRLDPSALDIFVIANVVGLTAALIKVLPVG